MPSRSADIEWVFGGEAFIAGEAGFICNDCVVVANGILEDEGLPTKG